MTRALILGAGRSRALRLHVSEAPPVEEIVTLDHNAAVQPDVVHDLSVIGLPFEADSFDQIHAYDVLEHTQPQGDAAAFFGEWMDFWRVLKPGGFFAGIVPRWDSLWAWGDPTHRRVINAGTLSFLDQSVYPRECAPGGTNRSDYRGLWRGDFELLWESNISAEQWGFVLRVIKPSRWTA